MDSCEHLLMRFGQWLREDFAHHFGFSVKYPFQIPGRFETWKVCAPFHVCQSRSACVWKEKRRLVGGGGEGQAHVCACACSFASASARDYICSMCLYL